MIRQRLWSGSPKYFVLGLPSCLYWTAFQHPGRSASSSTAFWILWRSSQSAFDAGVNPAVEARSSRITSRTSARTAPAAPGLKGGKMHYTVTPLHSGGFRTEATVEDAHLLVGKPRGVQLTTLCEEWGLDPEKVLSHKWGIKKSRNPW